MPYIQRKIYMRNTIDVERVYSGRYGRAAERGEKKKLTPEAVSRNNERVAVKKLKRLLNANFGPEDFHITLTYCPEERPDKEGAHKCMKSFLGKMKRRYGKRGTEIKYIAVTEYKGKNIHHHIVMNGYLGEGENTITLVRECWKCGRARFVPLEENGEYIRLAEYLVKETRNSFREKNGPGKQRYTRSRNLIVPKEEVKVMQAKAWKSEPKPPKGYYIDKETFFDGYSEVTGKRMQYYTCIKIREAGVR